MPERSRPVVDLSATCTCGAVKVAVRGPVYSMLLCSCEDCQKATGTGHSAVAVFDAAGVTVTGSGTGSLTLEGSIADINTFIGNSALSFQTALNATGNVVLTVGTPSRSPAG